LARVEIALFQFFHTFSRPCSGMAETRPDVLDRDGHGTSL
jgi:hypothetical protein